MFLLVEAKVVLEQSKLPSKVLHAIWSLADVDKDGALTLAEFALAKHFIKMKLDGQAFSFTFSAFLSL